MFIARKTLAKYGAQIPTVRSTGGRQAPSGKQATSGDTSPKAARPAVKVGDKKR